MMRWRRNKADARVSNIARLAMVASTLWPGSWPPSPGLAPWAILIWIMVGINEVFGGRAKTARGDLLDGGAHRIAIGQRGEPVRFFAAFASVGFAADAVHGNRKGRSGLHG